MENKRELFRIALQRSAEIRRGNEFATCELLDLTEKGIQLKTELPVQVGDTLQLEFSLSTDCAISCTIQAMRVNPPHVGGSITSISPDDQQRLGRFIDQLNALHMTGF